MLVSQIQQQANDLGIRGAKMRKGDLIRAIQSAEGNAACFGAEWRFSCSQMDCTWREDCLKKNPG
jgi:hypothetical protein